jgi:2-methylaconitate cis-trans-isomerase PrpF
MTSRLETDRGLRRIPCVIMRGGTSRGPFFLESDLPQDPALRDQVLIAAMGSPHALQVDGIGGGNSLTSKVAIIGAPSHPGADVDYLFAQVSVESSKVDFNPNCGNMLAGVGPFALEAGLVAACDGETTVRIFNRNTKTLIHAVVQTPGGQVAMEGQTRIDGVLGTSAPIHLTFLNAMGSKTCALLPTGASIDVIHNIEVSLVDYAMPMVLMRASDLMLSGDELPGEIDANSALLRQIEAIRIVAGKRMGLGDVTDHVIPKIGLLSAPRRGGTVRALAVTSKVRVTAFPVIPTVAELGWPDYETSAWYGFVVPAGVPKPVIEHLRSATVEAINTPALKERLIKEGATPLGSSPEEFAALLGKEHARWGALIKETGLRHD